ncbi:MAG: MmgE/PrpD family protein [Burkholderiales bacterium]
MSEAGPSATLARFLAQSQWDEVPAAVRQEGKRAILNILGCMLAGQREPAVKLLARSLGRGGNAANRGAVLAAAANALDFDDTHLPTVIHPSAPVAGALLALARDRSLSGPDFLHAFILGVEAACRVGNAVSPGHYESGWHITGTCGVFGAAAAAARLLKLGEAQVLSALGFAATQAAGLVEMLGSGARVLNAGFAARNGVTAALLAAQGLEGPAQPLEGDRGFVQVFGGSRRLGALTEGLGKQWALREVAYKPYPCGVVLHALIDACLKLRNGTAEFQRIEIQLHPLAIERGDRPHPRNAYEARLSAQHCAAVALLYGKAGVAEFTDEAAARPQVALMRARVKLAADDSLDKAGAVAIVDEKAMRAEPWRSLSGAELEAKFRSLAGGRADELLRLIDSIESAGKLALRL